MRIAAFARASHLAPTLAVTFVITALAWSIGWRWPGVALVLITVLVGQLSVGWSNDAFDARLDVSIGREGKPTVSGEVTSRALWLAAVAALSTSSALSWAVAGLVGGSFHVFSLAMAWLYNTVLSRTVWSWLPYALAFGAVPPFVTFGLDGSPPASWMVAVFAVVGVSAHLANALPDIESDEAAGMGGLAVQLGARRSEQWSWLLLGAGTAVLALVVADGRPLLAMVAVVAYVLAMVISRRAGAFHALISVVVVDVVTLVLAAGLGE